MEGKEKPDDTGLSSSTHPATAESDKASSSTESGQTAVETYEPPPTNWTDAAPPDGGLTAWLVLLGAFVVTLQTYGLVNSFGVFQTYYETDLLVGRSSSDISWIGSLQGALLTMLGIVSGPLYDRGYFNYLMASGLFLVVFGMFMTSLCRVYWQVILAQGVAVGLGCGLILLPSVAILSQYFAKRRAIAVGIQSVGSPLGGIIFPIIFSRLEPVLGFGWATRVIAFILLGTAPIPLLSMRPRIPPPKQKRAFLDNSAFTDVPFILCTVASIFTFLGLYIPIFYVQLYSIRFHIASDDFSAYLVTLLNVGSIFGRLLPNFMADRVGSMNMLIATTFGTAVLAYGWLGVRDLAGVIVFALLYGFFNGGVTSLPPSAIVALTPDLSRLGTRLGMLFFMVGISVLIGNPLAGVILGDSLALSSWRGLIAFSATALLVGAAFYLLSQFFHLKEKKRAAARV